MKRIFYATIIAISILSLTACSPKDAITAEEFTSRMIEAGYSVEKMDESTIASGAESYLLASCGDFIIEFIIHETVAGARSMFNEVKLYLEDTRENSASTREMNVSNYNRFAQTTGGRYSVASRIDNTVVYVITSSENKDDVNTTLALLGY